MTTPLSRSEQQEARVHRMASILATEGVPGYVFGRIRAYREEHPESWRDDQTAVYGESLIAAYEQWERCLCGEEAFCPTHGFCP